MDTTYTLRTALIEAGALRQLRHNDGSGGFVVAYDKDITDRVLAGQASIVEGAANKTPIEDPNYLLSTMDAKEWADAFCKRNSASDHATMIGWFANAIMTGYDMGQKAAAKQKS
jgi:hypothetical protein